MIGANVDAGKVLAANVKKYRGAMVVVMKRFDGQQTIMSKPS